MAILIIITTTKIIITKTTITITMIIIVMTIIIIIFRIPDSGIKPISWYQHSATLKSTISSNRLTRKGFPKPVYSGKLLSYILRDKYQLAIT